MGNYQQFELLKKSAVAKIATDLDQRTANRLQSWENTRNYDTVYSFDDGFTIAEDERQKVALFDGEWYRWDGTLPKTVPAGSTPQDEGGIDPGAWRSIGDAALRSDLSDESDLALGSSLIRRNVVSLNSLKDLSDPRLPRREDLRYDNDGFYADSNVGGGSWRWKPNEPKANHNGGTIVDPDRVAAWDGTQGDLATLFTVGSGVGLGCYVRVQLSVLRSPEIFTSWFGLEDGELDSILSIEQAIKTAKDQYPSLGNGRVRGRVRVVLTEGKGGRVRTDRTLFIPPEVDIWMEVPIRYCGAAQTPCVVHGEAGTYIFAGESKYKVVRDLNTHRWHQDVQPDYTEEDVGLVIINPMSNNSHIDTIQTFEVGFKLVGDRGGAGYNKFFMGDFFNNKITQWLHSFDHAGGIGWVNENTFYNGRYGAGNSSVNNQTCQAVRSTSDRSAGNNNNNTWYTPSFEGMGRGVDAGKPIIDAVRLSDSRFLNVRDENPGSSLFVREGELSHSNEFTFGYSPLDGVLSRFESNSKLNTSLRSYGSQSKIKDTMQTVVFDSGRMQSNAVVSGNRTHVKGVKLTPISDGINPKSPTYSDTGITVSENGISGSAKAASVHLKLNGCNQLLIKAYGRTRPYIVCYDEDFNQITDLEANKHITNIIAARAYSVSSYFGGCYFPPYNDEDKYEYYIGVIDESVAYLGIFMALSSGEPTERFLVLTNAQNQGVVSFQNGKQIVDGALQNTAPPTEGDFERGAVVYNESPSAGGYQGWVCVESGSLGTWKGFGLIDN